MKAYAVFSGGGVRGAALAGCLDAAQAMGVEFVGYGGVSAGAIVALLAAAKFTGPEMLKLMQGDLHPSSMLDDRGKRLDVVLSVARAFRGAFPTLTREGLQLPMAALRGLTSPACWARLWGGGLYDANPICDKLDELVRGKVEVTPRLESGFTFSQLWDATSVELKIISSNITSRRAVLYSRHDSEGSAPVANAVVASMAYPFVFKPLRQPSGHLLADGGLTSNLPSFLFSRERESTKHPVLAFSLEPTESVSRGGLNFVSLLEDLVRTGLEAGDALIMSHLEGVHPIVVSGSAKVGTLKFGLTSTDVETLYDAGFRSTTKALGRLAQYRASRDAGTELRRQLWATHVAPGVVSPVLVLAKQVVEGQSKAVDVRATVMLPTGRSPASRIVAYHAGSRAGDGDIDLEIAEQEGCTGLAVRQRRPALVDLTDWKAPGALSAEAREKMPTDRKTLMSFPLFAWKRGVGPITTQPIIGVLSLDTTTGLMDSGWAIPASGAAGTELAIPRELLDKMVDIAAILSKLLS